MNDTLTAFDLTSELDHQIGSAAIVVTAADRPLAVHHSGDPVIAVNTLDVELASVASMSLRYPAGAMQERLLQLVAEGQGESV